MGRFIKKERLKPDLVLSSPAVRARDTIRIVLESAGLAVAVRYEPDIYLASCARLLEVVSQIENDRHRVVVVGHNPGMEELIHRLTGVARPMPTAALANVALDVEQWTEVSARNCGHLEWLVSPKQLEILSLMPKRERS
jgi:phosphohistidine phosphatase